MYALNTDIVYEGDDGILRHIGPKVTKVVKVIYGDYEIHILPEDHVDLFGNPIYRARLYKSGMEITDKFPNFRFKEIRMFDGRASIITNDLQSLVKRMIWKMQYNGKTITK